MFAALASLALMALDGSSAAVDWALHPAYLEQASTLTSTSHSVVALPAEDVSFRILLAGDTESSRVPADWLRAIDVAILRGCEPIPETDPTLRLAERPKFQAELIRRRSAATPTMELVRTEDLVGREVAAARGSVRFEEVGDYRILALYRPGIVDSLDTAMSPALINGNGFPPRTMCVQVIDQRSPRQDAVRFRALSRIAKTPEESADLMRQAVASVPESPSLRAELGLVLDKAGETAAAAEALAEALSMEWSGDWFGSSANDEKLARARARLELLQRDASSARRNGASR
jgi:hypothetical protein